MHDIIGYSMIALLANAMTAAVAMCLTVLMIWLSTRMVRRRLDVFIELQKDNRAVAIVVAAVLISVALVASNAFGGTVQSSGFKVQGFDTYDHYFRHYGHRFFARAVDWQWFKAQSIAESSLNPDAVSPAGARGLMQIMPATSKELAGRLRIPDRPLLPRIAVLMGIAYDRQMWAMWPKANFSNRLQLMFGAYNAGPGNIRKAEKKAICPNSWGCVMLALQDVTGRHARETVRYVYKIEQIKKRL